MNAFMDELKSSRVKNIMSGVIVCASVASVAYYFNIATAPALGIISSIVVGLMSYVQAIHNNKDATMNIFGYNLLGGIIVGIICVILNHKAVAETIPNHVFKIDGACTVSFSPRGGIEVSLVKYINSATTSVHVMAYSFTSLPIAKALISAKIRGLDVQVVLDKSNLIATYSKLSMVKAIGIPTYVDSAHAISHDKIIIVDGKQIELGSYNYSSAAETSNGENAMICPSVEGATLYETHFKYHKIHSALQ